MLIWLLFNYTCNAVLRATKATHQVCMLGQWHLKTGFSDNKSQTLYAFRAGLIFRRLLIPNAFVVKTGKSVRTVRITWQDCELLVIMKERSYAFERPKNFECVYFSCPARTFSERFYMLKHAFKKYHKNHFKPSVNCVWDSFFTINTSAELLSEIFSNRWRLAKWSVRDFPYNSSSKPLRRKPLAHVYLIRGLLAYWKMRKSTICNTHPEQSRWTGYMES